MNCLTPREIQIVELVCKGKVNKEIAYELKITTGTVKVYLFNLYKKIQVTNRVEAAMWGVTHGVAPRWTGEYEI